MKVIILCAVLLAAIVIALAARAIRTNAGRPALDDPKNATPPPARGISLSGRRDEPS